MEPPTLVAASSATLRIVASYAPSRGAEEIENLRLQMRLHDRIPEDVRETAFDMMLASVTDAREFLIAEYEVRRSRLTDAQAMSWTGLIEQFGLTARRERQPNIAEVTRLLLDVVHCSSSAWDVARQLDRGW